MCVLDQLALLRHRIGDFGSLILSRKKGELVVLTIPPCDHERKFFVSVIELRAATARLGFSGDRAIGVVRFEITDPEREAA